MLNIHDLIRLTAPKHPDAFCRTIVFDGKVAVSMANARRPDRWWAAVPFTDAQVTEPTAVPVDGIKTHLLKSRHLFVARDHVHNNQGMRTQWSRTLDWNNILASMPPKPEGIPVQFDVDLDSLDRVLVVINPDDIRTSVQGVFLDFESGRMAGTDGHRVHLFERRVPKLTRKKDQGALQVILPKAPLHWLLRSSDKTARVSVWQLGKPEALVMLQTSDALVYVRSIDTKFPEVMRVIPERSNVDGRARIKPGEFSDKVASMAKLGSVSLNGTTKQVKVVTIHWGEGRIYAADGPHFVEFTRQLVDYPEKSASKLYARYTPAFLEDLADCVTEGADWCQPLPREVKPGQGSAGAVLAVFDGDFSGVVMPMKWADTPPSDRAPGGPEKPAQGAGKPPGAGAAPKGAGKPAQTGQKAGPQGGKPTPPPPPGKAPGGPEKPAQGAGKPTGAGAAPKGAGKPAQTGQKAGPKGGKPTPKATGTKPDPAVVPASKALH